MHYEPLKEKTLKDTSSSPQVFDLVDWDLFHKVILSLPRSQQITFNQVKPWAVGGTPMPNIINIMGHRMSVQRAMTTERP
jgi:hypothetical protein